MLFRDEVELSGEVEGKVSRTNLHQLVLGEEYDINLVLNQQNTTTNQSFSLTACKYKHIYNYNYIIITITITITITIII